MKIADNIDNAYKIDKNLRSNIQLHEWIGSEDVFFNNGYVRTLYGIVITYSESRRGKGFTDFDFIYNGKIHHRVIYQYFKPRYVATLARRFAADVVESNK